MKIKIHKVSRESCLNCFFIILLIHPLQTCMNSILEYFGIPFRYLMDLLYLATFIYGFFIVLKLGIKQKDFLAIICFSIFYGICYLYAGENARQYFWNPEMIVLYFFYMPLSFLVVSKISDWSQLFKENKNIYISDIIIVLSFVSQLLNPRGMDYMSYSYNLLPFWCVILISILLNRKKIQMFFLTLGVLEGIFFGSRGAVAWLVVCGILIIAIQIFNKNGVKSLIKYSMAFVGVLILFKIIYPMIMESSFVEGSYILRRIKDGSLLISDGRSELATSCLNVIDNMGFSVYGLFYDRTVLPNGWYSHNIIYEVLISFGWIIGGVCLVFFFFKLIVVFFLQNHINKIAFVFLLSSLFFRYFLSGSIFDEGNFWVFVGGVTSFSRISMNSHFKYKIKFRN